MKLLIIRHGDPDYVNDTVTEKGKKEAELLSKMLQKMKIDYVYCSPLGRAKATAEPYLRATGANVQVIDWLREFNSFLINPETNEKRYPWDMKPLYWTQTENYFDRNSWLETDLMKTGDTKEKYNYVCDSFDALLKKHGYERHSNYYNAVHPNSDTIAFFCHFGVESVLLSRILNISPMLIWHGFAALPTSVTTVVTEEREQGVAYFRCLSFGDLSHLYSGNEPPSFAARFCEEYTNTEQRH